MSVWPRRTNRALTCIKASLEFRSRDKDLLQLLVRDKLWLDWQVNSSVCITCGTVAVVPPRNADVMKLSDKLRILRECRLGLTAAEIALDRPNDKSILSLFCNRIDRCRSFSVVINKLHFCVSSFSLNLLVEAVANQSLPSIVCRSITFQLSSDAGS